MSDGTPKATTDESIERVFVEVERVLAEIERLRKQVEQLTRERDSARRMVCDRAGTARFDVAKRHGWIGLYD